MSCLSGKAIFISWQRSLSFPGECAQLPLESHLGAQRGHFFPTRSTGPSPGMASVWDDPCLLSDAPTSSESTLPAHICGVWYVEHVSGSLWGQGSRTITGIFLAQCREPGKLHVHTAGRQGRTKALEPARAAFEAHLCQLLGVQPRTICSTKLSLSFLICRMDVPIGSVGLL